MYSRILTNKKPIASMAVTSILISALGACSPNDPKASEQQQTEVAPVTLATAAIQHIQPEYEISIPGELEPYEQVAIHAKISGFVKELHVDRGDHVQKGQLLAVLEAPEMEQQYLSDRSTEQKIYNDYLYAQQAYERLVDASATTGAVAAIELDRAKSAMESAKSAYEASKAGTAHSSQLQKYLRITAPFNGIITERNISVGALAGTGSGTPLFTMAQSDKFRLTLSLPEKHASSVQSGLQAKFTVNSQPGKTFKAVLSRTSGLLDQQNRSLTLEFDVNNLSGRLQGGEYAQVNLMLRRKEPSYWVPRESILTTQSGTYIMTTTKDSIKRISVEEGIRLDTLTEVYGNLSPNDRVLLKPSAEIRVGSIK